MVLSFGCWYKLRFLYENKLWFWFFEKFNDFLLLGEKNEYLIKYVSNYYVLLSKAFATLCAASASSILPPPLPLPLPPLNIDDVG